VLRLSYSVYNCNKPWQTIRHDGVHLRARPRQPGINRGRADHPQCPHRAPEQPGPRNVRVNPGLDHDGDPVLFLHLKFRLVEPGIDPSLLSDSAISLRRALWEMGERRFPHLRYDFHDDQRILGTENW